MTTRWTFGAVILVLCSVLVAGCLVGPRYQRPATLVADMNRFDAGPAEPAGQSAVPPRWWEDFNDPVLTELVPRALTQNRDLLAAAAGVRQAEAALAQVRGGRGLRVDYGAQASRSRAGFDASFLGGGFESFYTTNTQQGLNISYVLDLFGRLRHGERAAMADWMATAADQEALQHAVVAQVCLTRVEVFTQQRLLAVADATVANWRDTVELIDRRIDSGLGNPLDRYYAQQSLAAAQAQREDLQRQLDLLIHSLDVLCGQRPGASRTLLASPGTWPVLGATPGVLPAALLERRPDVRAAEWQLRAATERIGVALATQYPDLTLNALVGFQSNRYQDLLTWKYRALTIGGQIAAPVFHGGALRAGIRGAEAAAEQAAQRYCQVVLVALREVEDALASEARLRRQIEYLERLLDLARQAEALARQRYEQGVDPMLNVLETERTRRQAENSVILAQGQCWQNRIRLLVALGGTWKTRVDES